MILAKQFTNDFHKVIYQRLMTNGVTDYRVISNITEFTFTILEKHQIIYNNVNTFLSISG